MKNIHLQLRNLIGQIESAMIQEQLPQMAFVYPNIILSMGQ